MGQTLCFVHASESSGEDIANDIRRMGWDVEMVDPLSGDAIDSVVTAAPLATVFCLSDECGPTRQLAEAILADGRMHRPLMVFTGGDGEQIEATKQSVPFAIFVRPEELHWMLKRLVFKE